MFVGLFCIQWRASNCQDRSQAYASVGHSTGACSRNGQFYCSKVEFFYCNSRRLRRYNEATCSRLLWSSVRIVLNFFVYLYLYSLVLSVRLSGTVGFFLLFLLVFILYLYLYSCSARVANKHLIQARYAAAAGGGCSVKDGSVMRPCSYKASVVRLLTAPVLMTSTDSSRRSRTIAWTDTSYRTDDSMLWTAS